MVDYYKDKCAEALASARAGVKHDTGKARFDLLPWDAIVAMCGALSIAIGELPWRALAEVAKVLAFGANKYGDRNWEKGIVHSRLFAAYMRHVASYRCGERTDPETGLHPLAHAACECMFAYAFEVRMQYTVYKNAIDDRPAYAAYTPTIDVVDESGIGDAARRYVSWWKSRQPTLAKALMGTLRVLDADLAGSRESVDPLSIALMAERAESARLRGENAQLRIDLADAKLNYSNVAFDSGVEIARLRRENAQLRIECMGPDA
jgi:hypothetical protein